MLLRYMTNINQRLQIDMLKKLRLSTERPMIEWFAFRVVAGGCAPRPPQMYMVEQ